MVDANGFGDFTTVSAAITAAISGQTIFIRPGTYTENPTLKDGVNLVCYEPNNSTAIIKGKLIYSGSTQVALFGLTLQTNGDFLLAHSGTGQIGIYNSDLLMTNNTGISVTSTGIVNINGCVGNTGTTGISLHTMATNGVINYVYCQFSNSGFTTTNSTNSNGAVGINFSGFNHPLVCSGTGSFTTTYSTHNAQALNVSPINFSGSGLQAAAYCTFLGGNAGAVAMGGTAQVLSCNIGSNNTNAIGGTGTLNKAYLVFTGTSSTIQGTITVNTYPTA